MKTSSHLVLATAVLMALALSPKTDAADATIGLDVQSAYVFRGITRNDSFVAQPFLDLQGLPIDLGIRGNLDLEEDPPRNVDQGQFSEMDFTGAYALPIERVDVAVGYTEYTYYNGNRDADREVSLSFGLDHALSPRLGMYYGIDGGNEENFYAEASVDRAMPLTQEVDLTLGALVGYINPGNTEEGDGFNQYSLSATLGYHALSLGVTYVGQLDDDILVDVEQGGGYDVEVVGTLGLSHNF